MPADSACLRVQNQKAALKTHGVTAFTADQLAERDAEIRGAGYEEGVQDGMTKLARLTVEGTKGLVNGTVEGTKGLVTGTVEGTKGLVKDPVGSIKGGPKKLGGAIMGTVGGTKAAAKKVHAMIGEALFEEKRGAEASAGLTAWACTATARPADDEAATATPRGNRSKELEHTLTERTAELAKSRSQIDVLQEAVRTQGEELAATRRAIALLSARA